MVHRTLRIASQIAIPIAFVGFAVGAGVLATLAGIQWWVTGIIVGSGIAHSALRASGLDALRSIHGSSENSLPMRQSEELDEVIAIRPELGDAEIGVRQFWPRPTATGEPS